MSLTFVAYTSRNMIKIGGVMLVSLALMWTVIGGAIKLYRAANPPKVTPTMRYGKLPAIVFPEKEIANKTFSKELPNDEFPKFPDQMKVYVIYRPDTAFLALEEDKQTAKSLGFVSEPREISSGVYEFVNNNLNQRLVMNVLEGNFTFKYPYESDQMVLSPESTLDKNNAINKAKSFLESANKLDEDLESGVTKTSFWKYEDGGLKSVTASSQANLIRVDFSRSLLDEEYPLLGKNPDEASVTVWVSGASVQAKQVVEASYKNVRIDRESFSTYPIKTVEQAWTDLTSGNYWPAKDSGQQQTAIRNVYLAYFEPVTLTNFLQPIFVFEGTDFVGYVPAIGNGNIKN